MLLTIKVCYGLKGRDVHEKKEEMFFINTAVSYVIIKSSF